MNNYNKIISEDASPNPEYLIKSIAEQGYSLETALADLMDNSISANANKIEVLINMETEPFRLFIADNGNGMTKQELSDSMQFPSSSPEYNRETKDLGRFGLGMKTASFSQTRKFTVISKKKGQDKYSGRTWDVSYLKKHGWKIIVNSEKEISDLVDQYEKLSHEYFNKFEDYTANTIVVWDGLYKFENYLTEEKRKESLKKEINEETADYLSLVFHRFMETSENPIQIRINNVQIVPFNPFPEEVKDFRQIEPKQSQFRHDIIKIEGFVLPSRSIGETRNGLTKWTTRYRGLMDMEGMYVYRANRIILFGGWNGIVKKAPRLQLARLRVEVGNKVDDLLHLNVAKSQITVPYELRVAFEHYIEELKVEAEREYYNRGIRKISGLKTQNHLQLFERSYSAKGSLLEVNKNFPVIRNLNESLSAEQKSKFNMILRMINTRVNNIRHVHEEEDFLGIEDKDGIAIEDLKITIEELLKSGITQDMIKEEILPNLGFKFSSIPDEIKSKLR